MRAAEFRQELMKIGPSAEMLREHGYAELDAHRESCAFALSSREHSEFFPIPDTAISSLFSEYDPSGVEIGFIRLDERPLPIDDSWVFGRVDADLLVLDGPSGEVVVWDAASPGHVLWRCAGDGHRFLSALLVLAREHAAELIDGLRVVKSPDVLEECTVKAGGSSYSDFYRMLLCDE